MQGRPHRLASGTANADIVVDRTFWIGVYPGLTTAHLDYMADMIRSFVAQHAKVPA
jgi:CDP-6-deoxy-D-xylo-4-hexulose-3-dehydrase